MNSSIGDWNSNSSNWVSIFGSGNSAPESGGVVVVVVPVIVVVGGTVDAGDTGIVDEKVSADGGGAAEEIPDKRRVNGDAKDGVFALRFIWAEAFEAEGGFGTIWR